MTEQQTKAKSSNKYQALGRRKEAHARVTLVPGKGNITVNKLSLEKYFQRENLRIDVVRPLVASNSEKKFDVKANVDGGGLSGQAGAIRLGIARALIKYEETLKVNLRNEGFLTRDARMKERKKYGQRGARKKFQFTKR